MLVADLLTRRFSVQPASLNADDRSVQVILSTGADVRRAGFVERLAMSADAWEIPESIPLLDGHRNGSFRDVLGQVRDIRFEAGRMVGTAFISNDDAWAAVERGDVRDVSIGYAPRKHSESRDAVSGDRIRTLTMATLREASLVPVGADPGAQTRTQPMDDDIIDAPEIVSDDVATTRAEIRTIGRAAGMATDAVDALIDRNATVTEARAAAFDAMQSRRVTINVTQSNEDPAVLVTRQTEALSCQLMGTEPSDAARPFMGLGMTDHARLILTRAGVAGIATMAAEPLITRAMHVSADFANLLTGTGTRILLASYAAAESPLKQLAVQRNLPDFRPGTNIRVGGIPKLKKVTETGEIKHTSTGEAAEGFKLDTYASIFSLSRQAIINDDLGGLTQWGTMAGRASAETEADTLIELFIQSSGAGPLMQDGKRLFHVDHGNLAATGADPDVDTLSVARLALRRQTGLDGVTPINVRPKFLLVSAELETVGEQLLAELAAATVGDANPFSGKLTLLVEPRLPESSWYVFADPATLPTLAYGYLTSAPGPQLASRDGWDVLGREFRVVLDFGCGALDWRGAYRNPGADL